MRVGNHADKLKRDRARSLQEIESELDIVILTSSEGIFITEKQLHINGCIYDIRESVGSTFSVSADVWPLPLLLPFLKLLLGG